MLNLDDIRRQIKLGKAHRDATYSCCGQSYSSLYDFRKHLYENHREQYDSMDPGLFHREVSKAVVKGNKRKINQRKHVNKKGKADHSLSIYKSNPLPISIPMGGQPGKRR